MAVLDPEELFEQAELLIVPRRAGPPRQVDIRRAVSASYYGIFHFVCIEVADMFVGRTVRREPRYARAYRSVEHGSLGTICRAVQATRVDPLIGPLAPVGGFSPALRQFAAGLIDLKARRHRADYDPLGLLRAADARVAVAIGRRSISSFQASGLIERTLFLTLLAFKGR